MKKTVFLLLVFVSFIALVIRYLLPWASTFLGYQPKAGIKITSIPEATVFINGKEVGKTPYQDENLQVKEYAVGLKSGNAEWQSKINLVNGTLAVINRELAENIASSSGEVLTLDKGKGATITSTPSSADVEIDGQLVGKTPISISNLSVGEHAFLISHDGYLKRSIRASLPEGLTLNLNVDLAISEVDLGTIPTPNITTITKLKVLPTSVGFLRLRDEPSTKGKEIGKLQTGDSLVLLEEQGDWFKVRTDAGLEGYVSASYVEKEVAS